jgi:heavy metal translocating P-type ATPase
MRTIVQFLRHSLLLVSALFGLGLGAALHFLGYSSVSRLAFLASTSVVLTHALWLTGRAVWRREFGVDLIAVFAMAGTLFLEEYLAGAILALMLTGGEALEQFATARARRALTALLERAPRVVHRRNDEGIVDVPVAEVQLGDVLMVKPGEVIPADGIVTSQHGVLDTSALTGESRPVQVDIGDRVQSGGTNVGGPLEFRVNTPPSESTYAGIIRLVHAAETSKAPFVRLADRYAMFFLLMTFVLSALAWLLSQDATRALAVLVVATPCPLILAAPAAIIAGVSRAARQGIIVKGGGPLEALAQVKVLLLDKTGTVTAAQPEVLAVEVFGASASDDVVRWAASLEQASVHPYAPAFIREARDRSLELSFPDKVHEEMGRGITGQVGNRRVAVGQLGFVAPGTSSEAMVRSIKLRTAVEGSAGVYVAVDDALVGAFILQDPVRVEAPRTLRALRAAGIQRIHMVTGDHPDVAELVGDVLGIDRVFAERTPEEKVDVVRQVRSEGTTAMVGDGINDAPALALADVGIAMGSRGATAASEAADVVLTADRLEGLLAAVRIAKRTRRIAVESVVVGMGMSVVAMGFAAAGYLPPVAGAILQEGIDVLVLLNALRALGSPRGSKKHRGGNAHLSKMLSDAHRSLRPRVGELAAVASRIDKLTPAEAKAELIQVHEMLETELLPHEREEQSTAYPVISQILGDEDPTGPLIQTHHEIHRLARLYGRMVAQLPEAGPRPEELRDLRRALYGLHAILTLHSAQEDELYSLLTSEEVHGASSR